MSTNKFDWTSSYRRRRLQTVISATVKRGTTTAMRRHNLSKV